MQCCVLGSGSFGTAIASILSRSKNHVTLWCRRNEVAEEISNHFTHTTYFQKAPSSFLRNVKATTNFEDLKYADIVIIAVPSQYLEEILHRATKYIPDTAVIVSLVKSLHLKNGKIEFTSSTIEKILLPRKNQVVVLHGPNIYTEMTDEMKGFAEATIGYRNSRSGLLAARKVKQAFDTKNFHTKLCSDRDGVELAGGLKNVLSLAAGFSKGMGLGSNTVAAIIRNGLNEMSRFAKVMNLRCRSDTFLREASGVGDMILTCTSGRGQYLASKFIQSLPRPTSFEESESLWRRLESELFPGMRLPDYENSKIVYRALKEQESRCCFIMEAVWKIAFGCVQNPRQYMINALRQSIDFEDTREVTLSGIRGRRAVVTGAGGTIGAEIVRELCSQGARVVAVDRDASSLEKLRQDTACDTLIVDLTDWDSLGHELESLNCDPSDECVSLVVNCAGVAVFEPIFETSSRAFDLQYNVNVKSLIRVTNVLAMEMVKRGVQGSIVNISSQSSGLSLKDHLVYSSTKASVDHVTRITAFELGPFGVRVNSVRPTVVMSELVRQNWDKDLLKVMKNQIPLKRLAMPENVASAVVFLLSQEASMITGVDLCVDGGRAACRL